MAGLLGQAGAQPQRDPKFVPLFMDRAFTGLYTQRSALRDPSDWATSKFYGGRPDALIDGLNIELTNRLTLQRRPGLVKFSTAVYPTSPNRAFAFQLADGTIRVIIDTGTTGTLDITSVNGTSGTDAVYTGSFPDGGSDAYVGMLFTISGFANEQNNGTFVCTGSTTTTLTLENDAAITETISATAISSGAVYYDHQSGGTKTLLFAKGEGAGQSYFIAVAGVMYVGDGVETWKYTPGNVNGEVWNWGIVAPTEPLELTVTSAGAGAVAWVASTFFSTMGVIVDSNGNTQQLVSVNADGSNPGSQFGLSSIGGPPWNHSIGGTTNDGTVIWRNVGTLLPWQLTTFYAQYVFAQSAGNTVSTSIFDEPSNAMYVQNGFDDLAQSGIFKPAFNGVPNSVYHESFSGTTFPITWICIGTVASRMWQPGFLTTTGSNPTFAVENPNNPLPDQISYIHEATNVGTTAASFASPPWETVADGVTIDNQLAWVNLGSATWTAATQYQAWRSSFGGGFSCIEDSNGDLQVCIDAGESGSLEPTWATEYGSITVDGTVKWSNVGVARTWNSAKSYHLPTIGFSPPSPTNSFGGSAISDSNDNIQYVIASGLSDTVEPTWDVDEGDTTTDNQITWFNNGPFVENSFLWSEGIQYVYAFKARTATDPYNTEAPPLWPNPLGVYLGSGTGAVSSASPKVVINTGNPGAIVTIKGVGSTDPQIDTIEIYRTTDGGATFLFLTDIPNPAPVGGDPGVWSFDDYMPDTATSELPGLNPLIQAPVNGVNDPPDDAFLPMVYNFQRIWGSVGSSVFFSGGPDTLIGNPNEAFDIADTFPFLANVIRLVKTSQGLVTFLTNSIELIGGGPLTASFYSVTLAPGIGLLSFNALDVYAGEIYFFSSDSQFKMLSPQLQLSNSGFPIGDQLNELDADSVYVAVLMSGLDSAIFIADGETGWFRCNPRQVPGGFSGPEPIWSPFAAITGGCKMVQTVETTPGVKKLLVGSTQPSEEILQRDLTIFTDDGVSYSANFVMGSMMLANPGQLALLKFIEADFSGVEYTPTVSFLLNEISGSFTPFTANPVFDPPSLYGTSIIPTSYSPNRYYFSGTASLARCRHMQIQVELGTNDVGSELLNLTIFGRLMIEP